MISLDDVLLMHENSVNDFGGSHGIRDQQMIESAIDRPYQTFDDEDLYPTPFHKAAAIMD